MSNRIDFFQSENRQLALPAGSVSVFIDGALCAALEPIEIVRAGWPEFSWATLSYNPAAFTAASVTMAEELQAEFVMGKNVCIRQFFNGVPPRAAAFSFPIFSGRIEGIETIVRSDGEGLEIKAADFSANLKRISVYGQRVVKGDEDSLFFAGFDSVFNPNGKPNAGPAVSAIGGKSYRIFCAEPAQSRFWSYAEAIVYLLCEYLPAGQLHTPMLSQLEAMTENQIARDLDVTGLNLLDALHRCCERVGLEFKFVPRLAPTGPGEAIMFYKNGSGRIVEMNCQKPKEQICISKTDIARLHSKKNFWPVTHKYIGQGDFKVYEATFELAKAWDPALEDTDYDKFSPSTNSLFYQVKDIYRKWCLNEAGDYSISPYNRGSAFGFSKIFGNGNFACCRRRFWPTLTTDKQGKSLGYFLEVSFDNGLHWWQYLHAFNNLLDECGVWLSSDRLDVDTWIAALKGVLKFRITASVVSDERLTASISNGPVNSAAPVVEHITMLPRQFKFRKVSDQSIFANSVDSELGMPDEVDDSTALYEFVRHWSAGASDAIETTDIQTPYLAFNYEVGDRVSSSPDGRDLLGCRSDDRSINYVERVHIDFRKQCTNLKIVRKRKVQ